MSATQAEVSSLLEKLLREDKRTVVNTLWDQFFAEEVTTDRERDELRATLEAVRGGTGPSAMEIHFNRFDLTIDAEANVATLQDILDVTETGTQTLSLAQFEARIGQP